MLFNSWPYVILVVALLPIYYHLRSGSWQVALLILGSFVFYAYGQPLLLLLLVASASINAVTSYLVDRVSGEAPSHSSLATDSKKNQSCNLSGLKSPLSSFNSPLFWAILGVAANLVVLGFFKYAGLFAATVADWFGQGVQPGYWLVMLPLPVGISFYTFQGVSLVVDVYRYGHQRNRAVFGMTQGAGFRQHYFRTVFFVCFFPQLVAGPIVKAHDFFPQIGRKQFAALRWESALRCLILGYFLKMGVADNLQAQTFWIEYPYFLKFSSVELLALLFGFSMQIFADFAGYSLIAIGTALLFGYRLPVNFNFPYIARSFSEFWRRWHISLSSWLKEYLYFALGGNRKGAGRTYLNLFLVMFLGGLWHGAAWSYAVWGTCHGLALACERPFRGWQKRHEGHWFYDTAAMAFVFAFVTLAWLLFQLPDFGDAVRYLQAIGENTARYIRLDRLLILGIYCLPVVLYHLHGYMRERNSVVGGRSAVAGDWSQGTGGRAQGSGDRGQVSGLPTFIYNAAYGGMLFWILFNSGSSAEFIYFQF